jgi:hypothetical protein
MHAKDPVSLENEPKYLDASKLKGIRMHGRRARDSILGHTRILWTKEGYFVKKGEEPTDLGAEEDNYQTSVGQSAAQTGEFVNPLSQTRIDLCEQMFFRDRSPLLLTRMRIQSP